MKQKNPKQRILLFFIALENNFLNENQLFGHSPLPLLKAFFIFLSWI